MSSKTYANRTFTFGKRTFGFLEKQRHKFFSLEK